jgi:uncharacterized membrane protein
MKPKGKMRTKHHRALNAVAAGLTAAALLYSLCSLLGHLTGSVAILRIGRLLDGLASLIVPFAVYAAALALAIVSVRARAGSVGTTVLAVAAVGCLFYLAYLALLLAMNL